MERAVFKLHRHAARIAPVFRQRQRRAPGYAPRRALYEQHAGVQPRRHEGRHGRAALFPAGEAEAVGDAAVFPVRVREQAQPAAVHHRPQRFRPADCEVVVDPLVDAAQPRVALPHAAEAAVRRQIAKETVREHVRPAARRQFAARFKNQRAVRQPFGLRHGRTVRAAARQGRVCPRRAPRPRRVWRQQLRCAVRGQRILRRGGALDLRRGALGRVHAPAGAGQALQPARGEQLGHGAPQRAHILPAVGGDEHQVARQAAGAQQGVAADERERRVALLKAVEARADDGLVAGDAVAPQLARRRHVLRARAGEGEGRCKVHRPGDVARPEAAARGQLAGDVGKALRPHGEGGAGRGKCRAPVRSQGYGQAQPPSLPRPRFHRRGERDARPVQPAEGLAVLVRTPGARAVGERAEAEGRRVPARQARYEQRALLHFRAQPQLPKGGMVYIIVEPRQHGHELHAQLARARAAAAEHEFAQFRRVPGGHGGEGARLQTLPAAREGGKSAREKVLEGEAALRAGQGQQIHGLPAADEAGGDARRAAQGVLRAQIDAVAGGGCSREAGIS